MNFAEYRGISDKYIAFALTVGGKINETREPPFGLIGEADVRERRIRYTHRPSLNAPRISSVSCMCILGHAM